MSSVDSIGGATGAQATGTSPASAAQVDYETFLQLLTTQLKNQDPTEPMDSTEYIAQLAAFSQVEQAITANDKLDQLLASSALAMADGLIGRTVTTADGSISGEIVSVLSSSDGPIATLSTGENLLIGAGVSVS